MVRPWHSSYRKSRLNTDPFSFNFQYSEQWLSSLSIVVQGPIHFFFLVPLWMHGFKHTCALHCGHYSYWCSDGVILAYGSFFRLLPRLVVWHSKSLTTSLLFVIIRCPTLNLYFLARCGASPFSKHPWGFLVGNFQTTVWTLEMILALVWSLVLGLYGGNARKYTSIKHLQRLKMVAWETIQRPPPRTTYNTKI